MTQGYGNKTCAVASSKDGDGGSRKPLRGTKARQAAKRAAATPLAVGGDLELVLASIEALLPRMSLTDISAALQRLAKMTGAAPDGVALLREHPLVVKLLGEASTALEAADDARMCAPRCQALSNITWALATMGIVDKHLLSTVASCAEKSINDFKPFELSTILWGFAKLGAAEGATAMRAWSEPLFQASGCYILENADKFSFRCQVMITWAFATARQNNAALFHAVVGPMTQKIYTASCHELANTAWSFSTVGFYEEALLTELASRALLVLSDFEPQELSIMLWSFAAIGFVHEGFFDNAAMLACGMNLQAQHLANVLWAQSRVRPRHRTTRAALLALLPRCIQNIESFRPQELSSVALAAAKCFGHRGGQLAAPTTTPPPTDSLVLPPQVKDFFVSALPWVMRHLNEFSGQPLANITSAFVAVQIGGDVGLFHRIGQEVLRRVGALETSALLGLLRSLPGAPQGTWVHGAIRMLLAEAASRVDTMTPNEVQVLSKICLGLRGGAPQAQGSSDASGSELRDTCQALAQSGAWASAVLSDVWDEASEMPAALVASCGEKAGDATPLAEGAASDVAFSRSVSADNPETDTTCASDASTADEEERGADNCDRAAKQNGLHQGLILTVKNTFIDHAVLETDTDSTESDSEALAKPLPPPLDIIPADVSRETLEAYRTNYQRFRAGEAVKAKADVSTGLSGLETYW